jgi:hypothetical protein
MPARNGLPRFPVDLSVGCQRDRLGPHLISRDAGGEVAFVSGAAIAETVGKKHGAKLGDLQVTQSRWANNRRRRRQVDIMSLIGTTIYRGPPPDEYSRRSPFRAHLPIHLDSSARAASLGPDRARSSCPDACFIRLMNAARMAVFKSSRRDLVHLALIRHSDVIGCVSVYLGIQTVPAGR